MARRVKRKRPDKGSAYGPLSRWERCDFCKLRCRWVICGNGTNGKDACHRCYVPRAEAYRKDLERKIANLYGQRELSL